MIMNLASTWCWVILVSVLITVALSVVGLLANSYRETLLENMAMCCVAIAGVVVVLQIHTNGAAQGSGVAVYVAAVAGYALAKFLKARGAT